MHEGFGSGAGRGVCSQLLGSRAGELEKEGRLGDSEASTVLGKVGVSPMAWLLEGNSSICLLESFSVQDSLAVSRGNLAENP